MGAWGPEIFQNDTSSDVRDTFRDLVGWGYSPAEATAHLLNEFGDDPDVWLALAVTQWKRGWLQESVKAKALQVIDSGEDVQRYSENAKLTKNRTNVLAKTRALLESPQPAAKPLPKRKRFKETNGWAVGELISFQMSSGKYVVFRVCGHYDKYNGKRAILELLDYCDDAAPTLEAAQKLPVRLLIQKYPTKYYPIWQLMMCANSRQELPDKTRWGRLGLSDTLPGPTRESANRRWDHAPTGLPMLVEWNQMNANLQGLLPFSCRPGPGGDDHQHWAIGDVVAYQRPSGQYFLFQLIDRLHLYGFDGAPIVAALAWEAPRLPSANDIASGELAPLCNSLLPMMWCVCVLVHGDDAPVRQLELKRIGSFPAHYDLERHGQPEFRSLAMLMKESDREEWRPADKSDS